MPGRLVVVDDTEDLLFLMEDSLAREGYEVRTAVDGAKALALIQRDPPDAVILDLWMPKMDGFEVVRKLKDDPLLQHLPVLIMSAAGTHDNKIHGLDLWADDFVTKPFDMPELVARVRMVMRRAKISLDANPLTHLPGNTTIQSRVEKALRRGGPRAVLYCDLNDFKAYNDAYGYAAGDHAIRETARVILDSVKAVGAEHEDFVGHIGGDDFLVVTVPDRMETLAADICARFDAAVLSLYKDEDRARGRILSKDRKGNAVEFPFMSIAVGICHNSLKPLSGYSEVSALGSELKKAAKGKPGSAYFIDRRTV